MGEYAQHRLITPGAKFDPAVFTGAEMQTLEMVAAEWGDATAAQIEAATHAEAPWACSRDGQEIDYELAEYRNPIIHKNKRRVFLLFLHNKKEYETAGTPFLVQKIERALRQHPCQA